MVFLLSILHWEKEVLYNWVDATIEGGDLVVADLDGDGDLDVAACAVDGFDDVGAALVFYYDVGHTFIKDSLRDFAAGLGVGDLDGDLDLVLSREESLLVYYNLGPSWSSAVLDTGYGSYAMDVELADFDGDGDLDILQSREAVNDTSPIMLFENLGGGNFAAHPVGIHIRADGLAIADYDGDGDLDFAVVSGRPDWPGTGVAVYLQDTINSWTMNLLSSNTSDYDDWYIDQGDVNGDGRPDFVTPWPKLYLNQGGGSFQEVQLANWNHSLSYRFRGGAAMGDLDLDGDLDIVVQVGSENMTTPVVAIFWNDGSGNFSAPETLDTSHRPYISKIMIADFDRDSCPDIVANGGDEVVIYWCEELNAQEGEYTQAPKLYAKPGALILNLPSASRVRVYDATGRLVHEAQHPAGVSRLALKPGVYLVRVKGRTLRAAVP